MFSRFRVVRLAVPVMFAATAVGSAAQEPAGKAVVVLSFDQLAVMDGIQEVFGGEYDLGKGIAELVRIRLRDEHHIDVVTADADAQGSVEGTVVIFGKAEGQGDVGGVSVGRVRVGLGRRQEKAAVMLEARLIDKASGMMVTSVTGNGESDRGGMNVFAQVRGAGNLASLDLSGDEFKETSIGEATHKAVNELSKEIARAVSQLGTFAAAPPPEPAQPVPAAPMVPMGGGVVAGGPVGTFAWVPYQFRGTEHFRYDVRQTTGGDLETGYYQLDLEPAGADRVRMKVEGRIGDEEYSSTVTTGVGAQGMQMGYMQFMTMGPIGITLFNPMSWMMLQGQELSVGDGWTSSSGGESIAVQVESECSYSGQGGLLIVVRENDVVRQQSCVAPNVALPLRVQLNSDDEDVIDMTLVEYRP